MKKRSSGRWLQEHFSDAYVKRARSEGYRARSVYKLLEIDDRYKIIRPGMVIVDLGAAPGGWSQYLSEKVGPKGKIFALDILPMQPIGGIEFIQGDFTDPGVVKVLQSKLENCKIDLVLSDMAPNMSGIKEFDEMRSMELAKKAYNFAIQVLRPGGTFLIKTFQGSEFKGFLEELEKHFGKVKVIKPDSSRSRSSEVYLLAG
jgi:23S rRNA (uridine2552-2'-O)-methyltransferase